MTEEPKGHRASDPGPQATGQGDTVEAIEWVYTYSEWDEYEHIYKTPPSGEPILFICVGDNEE